MPTHLVLIGICLAIKFKLLTRNGYVCFDLLQKKNFRWILVGSRKMRKYKGQLQILFSRVPYLKSTLKVVFVFIVVVSVLLYMQEKHVKETSIALALKSRVTDEVVRLDNDTLLLDGLSNGKNSSEEGRVRTKMSVFHGKL